MNKETLDRLMIDRAVGALDSDVEDLLDDYLERTGVAAEQYSSTHEVVRLSRNLLQMEEETALPAFRVPKPIRNRRRRFIVLQAAGVAAMLMIGFFIGRGLSAGNGSMPKRSVVVTVTSSQPASDSGIWSIDCTRLRSMPVRPSRWKWTSPIRQPELVNEGELL